MDESWQDYRQKIIGLGEHSSRKSYYPELQEKIDQLQASQNNLETIINSISDGIVLHDSKGKIISLNRQALKIFNIPEEEMTRYSVTDIISKSFDVNTLYPVWNEVLLGNPQMIEVTVNRIGTAEEIDTLVSISRIMWQNSFAMVAVVKDISERKKYEKLLKISEERLRKLFENSNDAIFLFDKSRFTFLSANHAAELITGRSINEIKELDVEQIFPGNTKDKLQNLNRGESLPLGEVILNKPGGEERTALLHIGKIDDQIAFAIAYDITERIAAERKLEKQNVELLAALEKVKEMDRLKTIFFANMSHELRTPLVGLLGLSEYLEAELEGEFKEFAKKIYSSGQRLLDTLNGILKYSEIESHNIKPQFREIDLIKLIDAEIDLYQVVAGYKGIALLKNFEMKSIHLVTDEKLLQSICSNLINNAIKYTVKGSLTVSIVVNKENVQILFADTGIGIPKEKFDLIFQEFRQASEGVNRSFDGSGLGLAIVKKYVEIIGAGISLSSRIGKGSVFTLTLPLVNNDYKYEEGTVLQQNITPVIQGDSLLSVQRKKRLLAVDDESINLEVLNIFLKDLYLVHTASSGKEAVTKAQNENYDIILMDVNLKNDMDGLQTTAIIKKLPGYQDVPVVVVTAYAMKGDKEEFLNSGCTHYLSKPFSKKQLLSLLQSI
jgi:PAS domain S-box-containing protein